MSETIKIGREELATADVDRELAKRRALGGGRPPDPPPVSGIRRLLNNSLFYLPLAALIGAVSVWLILDRHIHDLATVGGEVMLIDKEPFAVGHGVRSMTIGEAEVLVPETGVTFEAGPQGEPAFASFDEIKVGDHVEAAGLASESHRVLATGIRPASAEHAAAMGDDVEERGVTAALLLFLPLTAVFIALGLLFAEGVSTRNWMRMIERCFIGGLLAAVFSAIAFYPASLAMSLAQASLNEPEGGRLVITIDTVSGKAFFIHTVCRSLAWACIGAGLGVGMNLARSTRAQLRNSVLGGTLGGALGGLFFDPIDRWIGSGTFSGASLSRLVGLIAVGLMVGLFVALVELLGREAWVRVRTGPLAGKSFVLYRTPTHLGSSPKADIYLFKDAEIDGDHAQIHRVGSAFEIEDMGSRHGTKVGGQAIRRRRLQSGDQIVVGNTVLEFEERAKRAPAAALNEGRG